MCKYSCCIWGIGRMLTIKTSSYFTFLCVFSAQRQGTVYLSLDVDSPGLCTHTAGDITPHHQTADVLQKTNTGSLAKWDNIDEVLTVKLSLCLDGIKVIQRTSIFKAL